MKPKTNSTMDYITENDRIYTRDADGNVIAEITFPNRCGISNIDHTFVDDSLRGQGIAGELVRLAADKILADGNKIAATCPYAVAWFKRHPAYPLADTDTPVACRIDKKR